MSMFSGITIALREDNGFELNMADVRMEFSESFQVLNSTAVKFDQWCTALDRLEQLNRSIEQHDGRADKSLITFLNQNNDLAEVLGVDLSFENWDDEAKGAEIQQGYSMAMEGVWEAIKNFFINIWEGIKNFFSNFFGMFKSVEAKAQTASNNAATIAQNIANAGQSTNGSSVSVKANPNSKFKLASSNSTNGASCVKMQAFKKKIKNITDLSSEFEGLGNAEAAITTILTKYSNNDIHGINPMFEAVGIYFKNGEPDISSVWKTEEVIAGKPDIAIAFKEAGWDQGSITSLTADVAAYRKAAEKITNSTKVLEEIGKMDDAKLTEILKKLGSLPKAAQDTSTDAGKEAANHALHTVKRVGKFYLTASKMLGIFIRDFMALLDDINSLGKQQVDAQNAKEKQAEANKKAKEEEAKQYKPL